MYIDRFENGCDLYINLIIEFIFFLIKLLISLLIVNIFIMIIIIVYLRLIFNEFCLGFFDYFFLYIEYKV